MTVGVGGCRFKVDLAGEVGEIKRRGRKNEKAGSAFSSDASVFEIVFVTMPFHV